MASEKTIKALEEARLSLFAARTDGGLGLTLAEVYTKACVGKATVFRGGENSYATKFKAWKSTLGRAPVPTEVATEKPQTIDNLREIMAVLANHIQVLSLAIEQRDAVIRALRAQTQNTNVLPFKAWNHGPAEPA